MNPNYVKMAKMLRVSPELIEDLDKKMSVVSGQHGVIDDIVKENDILVSSVLSQLNLSKDSSADDVYKALMKYLADMDKKLFEFLGKPDLSKLSHACGSLCESVLKVFPPPKGLFIKEEKAIALLEKYPPEGLLEHFKYPNIKELVKKEGFASVVSSLRFTQSKEWMHKFFDEAYSDLTKDDFEEREVKLIVLSDEWLKAAEGYLKKKYHNVSHLKEYGVIFVTPIKIDDPGETLRMVTLMLHYLHEVPFYSSLFKKLMDGDDFNAKFKSLLRGDVPSGQIMEGGKTVWRIIQRYIAKENENDPRFFEPHVNPEAEHWYKAEGDMDRLSRMIQEKRGGLNLGYWVGLDFVGDFFKDKNGQEQLISFDLIDLTISLAMKGRIKYLYHQEEALWNKIFSEYMGRETMNRLIEEHIIEGFIEL
jgi:hypothetical protein